jgi:hypothetical protein
MTAHALMPAGLVLKLGLVDLATGACLEEVRPFPRFRPAHVLPGRHSIHGSDLSSVTIARWAPSPVGPPRNATVTIMTTVSGSNDDLVVRAVCAGSDCGQVALNVSFACGWGRVCLPSTQTATELVGYPAGLPLVVAVDASAHHIGSTLEKDRASGGRSMEALAFPAYVSVGSSGLRVSPAQIDAMLADAEKRCALRPCVKTMLSFLLLGPLTR